MRVTYLEELDRLPPIICWLLAREARQGAGIPLTRLALAAKLGWSASKVRTISALWTWYTVSVGEADDFRRACGVTRHSERRQREYITRTFKGARSFAHIRSRKKAEIVAWIKSETAKMRHA